MISRKSPAVIVAQCPRPLEDNMIPLAASSTSRACSTTPTVTKLRKDGSNCSTEAGTSEDENESDSDLDSSKRKHIMQQTPLNTKLFFSKVRQRTFVSRHQVLNTFQSAVLAKQASAVILQRPSVSFDIKGKPASTCFAKRKSSHPCRLLQRRSDSFSGICGSQRPSLLSHRQLTGPKALVKKCCGIHLVRQADFSQRPHHLNTRQTSRDPLTTTVGLSRSTERSPPLVSGLTTPKPLSGHQLNVFSRSETLILFDWDDTLLPSSWLAARQLTLDPLSIPSEHEIAYLQAVSNTVCQLLVAAVHYGRVVVVTNAESGWVGLSAAKFIPDVLETLHHWHISVVSARSEFESSELQHPIQWKIHAFKHLLSLAYPAPSLHQAHRQEDQVQPLQKAVDQAEQQERKQSSALCGNNFRSLKSGCSQRKNVVSFGDSDSERIALIQCVRAVASNEEGSSLYKSFKLCEHPTPAILQRQLQLVQKLLPQIVHHSGNLDLRVNSKLSASSKVKKSREFPRTMR